MPLVCPTTAELPSTLDKWRSSDTSPLQAVWDPLRDWFSSEGLHVFDHEMGNTIVKPPVQELRAHDGTYSTHYGPPNIAHEHRVCEHKSLCPVCADAGRRDQFIVLLGLQMGAMYSFASSQKLEKGSKTLIFCNTLPRAIEHFSATITACPCCEHLFWTT